VLTLDRDERKMSLGIKQLTEDPWTKQDILTKYAVGSRHEGIVRNLTNFGLFIELEEGIDGLVHVSDLSWTKKIKHPSEFVKVGENLEVVVLELDLENRRLALGHKQIEENPWNAFEDIFTPGSVHKGTIVSKNDKGAVLELPYGIEGFVATRQLAKEDGSLADVGETLDFKVLEFSKEDKRIILSHTRVYSETPEETAAEAKKAKAAKPKKATQEAEKSTLGDLAVLSQLKEQMEEAKKPAKKAAPKAEAKKEEKEEQDVEAKPKKKAAKKKLDADEEEEA
jgi:small subunit ribosomal protein S1